MKKPTDTERVLAAVERLMDTMKSARIEPPWTLPLLATLLRECYFEGFPPAAEAVAAARRAIEAGR